VSINLRLVEFQSDLPINDDHDPAAFYPAGQTLKLLFAGISEYRWSDYDQGAHIGTFLEPCIGDLQAGDFVAALFEQCVIGERAIRRRLVGRAIAVLFGLITGAAVNEEEKIEEDEETEQPADK
jgi:hypothetical protein